MEKVGCSQVAQLELNFICGSKYTVPHLMILNQGFYPPPQLNTRCGDYEALLYEYYYDTLIQQSRSVMWHV
jgi:hypothetical protein